MSDYTKTLVTNCLRSKIIAEHAMRGNKFSWASVHPRRSTPEGEEFYRLQEEYEKAVSALWMATDFEYGEDGFREHVWNWRYWSVMARKCCWYQRFGTTWRAGRTMSKLGRAELKMVEACGLTDIYRSPESYIAEHFPNLRA